MGIAKLDGYYIPNHRPVTWRQTPGVQPDSTVIELARGDGEEFWSYYAGAYPVTLTLQEGEGKPREIRGLRVLRPTAPSRPELMAFVVVDIRWMWQTAWVLGRYNMRRKSGDRRIVGADALQNFVVVDDIAYHPASLNPPTGEGVAHTPLSIVGDTLRQINSDLPTRWRFQWSIGRVESGVRPENVEIDASGEAAMARALRTIPAATVKVTDAGAVVVYSQADASEVEQREKSGPAVRNAPIAVMGDNRIVCPRAVDVLFTREAEVRFDFFSDETRTRTQDAREFENVLPIPDPLPSANDPVYPPGTWMTFDKAFQLWGPLPGGVGTLTHDKARRLYLNPNLLAGIVGLAEARQDLGSLLDGTPALWAERIAAFKTHYLRTFRIPRRWVDRVLRWNDYRLAIIDTETGTRAPAQAYMDFALGMSKRAGLAGNALVARNIDGYATILQDGTLSPAEVRIVDHDEGIVNVQINLDPYGYADKSYPSKIDNIPTAQIGNVTGRPRWFGEIRGGVSALPATSLSADHKMAVILSGVPYYPTGVQQLHRVRVTPGDLGGFPSLVRGLPSSPAGPAWSLRIPAALETARFAWLDNLSNVTEEMFGVGGADAAGAGVSGAIDQAAQAATDLSAAGFTAGGTALGEGGAADSLLLNGDTLAAVARVAAGILYAGFRNRPVGQHTELLNADHELTGAMRSLVHTIARGQSTTTQEYLTSLPERSILSVLPEDAAAVVRRLVK